MRLTYQQLREQELATGVRVPPEVLIRAEGIPPADLAKLQAQIGGGPAPQAIKTYEVFGMLNGRMVPLSEVAIHAGGGRYVQVAGSQVLVGDAQGDGFGLAGTPGSWPMLYANQSPADYGLDADKAVLGHDGKRGWVLNAPFLAQVFGANWRQQIYG